MRAPALVSAILTALMVIQGGALAQEVGIDPSTVAAGDAWSLWSGGVQLRGANIFQRRVYPELDGSEFMGSGAVGPPYTASDFVRLAQLGANYVNISHPGLFTETPPYAVDHQVQAHLDNLLALIAAADLFAVISFRTGPGRSEFTFYWGEDGDWFDDSYYNDQVWVDGNAQQAWAAMWQHTASRYKDNPVVVGYDLMVEPNSNEVWLDEWDPEEFHDSYAGTTYDWNAFFPNVVAAIRLVDTSTPIIVGCMAYSAIEWLAYLEPVADQRTVYAVHQYAPIVYTHQDVGAGNDYPGSYDVDWDGQADTFDRGWLDELLDAVDDFEALHQAPVAMNEFGVHRWTPDGADFMSDQMELFEQRGMNHALWVWDPSWTSWTEEVNAFNFLFGDDPNSTTEVASSDLRDAITEAWGRNTVRPSTFGAVSCTPGATTLCLNDGRFEVTSQYATNQGQSGAGQAVELTDDTGYFWFFDQDNVEVVVKVLDACGVNGHHWVFAAGLTNVQVSLTVRETSNGTSRVYTNLLGTSFQPIQDTLAFSGCR